MVVFIMIVLLAAAIAVVYRVGRSLLAASRPPNPPSRPAVAYANSTPAAPAKAKSVALVVLGDIGRSPRMLYHANSFARNGFETRIVAHRGAPQSVSPFFGRPGLSNPCSGALMPLLGSAPPDALTARSNVHFDYLETPLAWVSRLPRPLFLLFAPLKILLGAFGLYRTLMSLRSPPGYLFVQVRITLPSQLDSTPSSLTERMLQNPPAIPTLAIVKLVALLRGSRVIVDWHNTGYSVLALRLGNDHLAVSLAQSCAPPLPVPCLARN